MLLDVFFMVCSTTVFIRNLWILTNGCSDRNTTMHHLCIRLSPRIQPHPWQSGKEKKSISHWIFSYSPHLNDLRLLYARSHGAADVDRASWLSRRSFVLLTFSWKQFDSGPWHIHCWKFHGWCTSCGWTLRLRRLFHTNFSVFCFRQIYRCYIVWNSIWVALPLVLIFVASTGEEFDFFFFGNDR